LPCYAYLAQDRLSGIVVINIKKFEQVNNMDIVMKNYKSNEINKHLLKEAHIYLFILCILFSLLWGVLNETKSKPFTDRIEWVKQLDSSDVLFGKDINSLNRLFANNKYSFVSEYLTTVKAGGVSQDIYVNATNQECFLFTPSRMIKGEFLNEYHLKQASSVVVISDRLALSLFLTLEVLGENIILNGLSYKIVGVYKYPSNPLFLPGGYDKEVVYIPINSILNYKELPINQILFSIPEEFQSIYSVFDKSNDYELVNKLNNFQCNLYRHNSRKFNQWTNILNFIMGLTVILLIFRLIIRLLKKLIKYMKANLEDYYFKDLLLRFKIYIILFLPLLVLIIIIILWISKQIQFDFFYEQGDIPPENLFDISYYCMNFKRRLVESRLSTGLVTEYQVIHNWTLGLIRGVGMLTLVSLVFFLYSIKKLFLSSDEMHKSILMLAIPFLLGLIIGLLITFGLNMTPYIAWKTIILFLMLIVLSSLDSKYAYSTIISY